MAAIAPTPAGTASCMKVPRLRTRRTASAKERAPAATHAEYSPSECPAAKPAPSSRSGDSERSASRAAIECVRIAGCVLAVDRSSSSGPSKQSRVSSNPRAASASSKTARAAGEPSKSARPIPTNCAPWPGKRRTRLKRALLPTQKNRAPHEPRSERRQQHEVAVRDPPGARALVERDRDRGRRRVAEAFDVLVDLRSRNLQLLPDGVDDPLVRLVRDEEGDLLVREALLGEQLGRDVGHRLHGDLERLVPLHLDVRELLRELGRVVRRTVRAAARHADEVGVVAVRLHDASEDAVVALRRLEDDGAGAVAEEDARRAVGPVHDAREDLSADDEDVLRLARLDEAVGEVKAVEETGARRRQVRRRRLRRAEVALDEARGRRKERVARDRPDEDHVEVFRGHVRALQRELRRLRAQVGELLPLRDDVALLDPGPRRDPLVRGVDELLQVGVRQELFRHGGAGADDSGPVHALTRVASREWSSAIEDWIFSARPCRENSAANRMAFLIAFALDRP